MMMMMMMVVVVVVVVVITMMMIKCEMQLETSDVVQDKRMDLKQPYTWWSKNMMLRMLTS